MESAYPQDLLVGVFPLVFAVNALLDSASSTAKRSLFDRFLDAIAAALVDGDVMDERRRSSSLFHPVSEEDSSDEDDFEDHRRHSSSSLSAGFYAGLGGRRLSSSHHGPPPAEVSRATYAKALQHGQGFFQRARIESVSMKHGFPPSKDPEGQNSLADHFPAWLRTRDPNLLAQLIAQYPLTGILPAGWLEKHVHALPSVILVVCGVSTNRAEQEEQDRRLLSTIEHFSLSLVEKRQCKIHVVGLLSDEVSPVQGDQWGRTIMSLLTEDGPPNTEPPFSVTLLRASTDLTGNESGLPTSQALRGLHQSVREASMVYYLTQARRTKEKLRKLTEDKRRRGQQSPPEPLLPLVIRYCFKIAIFYEFQWKHEKSLRFMVEGYRHAMRYYEWLSSRTVALPTTSEEPNAPHSVDDTGSDTFEVELSEDADDKRIWEAVIPPPPDDMVHQCRAVAEWLNLKLLLAGFASHTEGGLLAAANQWRQHCRLFCTRRRSIIEEEWLDWAYIARQRLVMSQLVERHPPKALGDLGNDYDEVLLRCSPWRCYESAVEATLLIAREVDRAQSRTDLISADETKDPLRPRFVGGLDSEGLLPELHRLCQINHRAKALELVLRSISLYERELEKEKRGFYAEDHFRERSSSRAGARLYYLAGGILLGMDRHQEAAGHLEKASKYSRGWPQLELAVRRMLIECYEKHLPTSSQASSESNQAIASMILDSYFNAQMSPRDLRRALGHFASITGGGSLKWHHETVDEEDTSLPFAFAVSFPGKTHATAGDTVQASVLIMSNLDYAVHVNSVVLLSLAGQLPIPSMDLLSATNVSEGSEGGIIIQSKTSIIISTEVELPKDLSVIAADDSGNGGETQGVAGKGSFAKSARPRTAGITAAGGARLVSEEDLSQDNRASTGWSLRFLGGKPLRCDGMRLVFYPVQAEKAAGSGETVTLIDFTLQKKKPKTAANIKRTPFEEENYLASAWSRPMHLPLSRGPRSLRVLGPMPELVIKDVTEEATGGSVLEGTVNRILLRLTSGPQELCTDIKVKVTCFSVLVTPSGSTRRLVSEEELTPDAEGSISMKNCKHRTPTLVAADDLTSETDTGLGYHLPRGWKLAGSGQSYSYPTMSMLEGGQSKFIDLCLYRPAPLLQTSGFLADDDENVADASLCKTDFYVTVTYRQERKLPQTFKRSSIRRSNRRRKPVVRSASASEEPLGGMPSFDEPETKEEPNEGGTSSAEVSLEYNGTVMWGKPLSATFRPGVKRGCPSGSRALSNQENQPPAADKVLTLVEGESVTTNCAFKAEGSVDGLKTELIGVYFEDTADKDSSLGLLGCTNRDRLLYAPKPDNPCRVLSVGSILNVAFTVRPSLPNATVGSVFQCALGKIRVDWKPSSLPLPSDLQDTAELGAIPGHGPLRLEAPSTIRFSGPSCRIERAPFEASLVSLPPAPRVTTPFEIDYRIRNKTPIHHNVSVEVVDAKSDGLLFSGLTNGQLMLAPEEERTISITILATRSGRVRLPSVQVISTDEGTLIVEAAPKEVYVFP